MQEFCNFARSGGDLSFWGIGYNYRMPEIMGAVALPQLLKLDMIVEKRRSNAAYLTKALEGVSSIHLPKEASWAKNVWWMYPIRLDLSRLSADRQMIVDALKAEGVGASHPGLPDHLQPAFSTQKDIVETHCPVKYFKPCVQVSYEKGLCPNAEKLAAEIVWIPGCSPTIQRQDLDDIAAAVRKVVSAYESAEETER
jgi:dTDP-4-amino-4,6-dideoxygalactose transaminase